MPVAPRFPFHKVTCPSCGWSHIVVQRSDVIFGPSRCGGCAGENLLHSVPNLIEAMLAWPKEFIRLVIRGR